MECAASTTLHTHSSLQICTISRHGKSTPGVDMILSKSATILRSLRLVPAFNGPAFTVCRCRRNLAKTSVPASGKLRVNSEMLGFGPTSEMLYAALYTVLNAVLAVEVLRTSAISARTMCHVLMTSISSSCQSKFLKTVLIPVATLATKTHSSLSAPIRLATRARTSVSKGSYVNHINWSGLAST